MSSSIPPTVKLNSGHDMPILGMGLWKIPKPECADTIYNAIKMGYRLFDGAADYGNEVECGHGVARALKEGIVKREELFIVSKLWNTFHDPERVEPIVRRQLKDWGLDYFDLYVMHFPCALEYVDPAVRYPPGWFYDDAETEIRQSHTTIQQTWQAMEELVPKGLARSISVSNFQSQSLYDVLRYAKIPPATLQVEHHPYLVQPELMKAAKGVGIQVTAYSSFGPAGFVEMDMKQAKNAVPLMQSPVIKKIAEKHGKSPAAVLLRWSTQQGIAVIPKATDHALMQDNLDSLKFNLDAAEIEEIDDLDRHARFNHPVHYFPTDKFWIFG